ncbi:RagB/SusD family nutrient uptake outer membrane protein [Neotamlana laminarinivorans]|uniref:RagB/SusD family nutrient uptake outer membrane protein n=1 Tax=Neotamlana laminarinivorans TaxID=2883124 RepID=A0A9X1HZ56_9FLAO|nr:RagB/SusD family nutrient uptake outer membrane protein [Tamlana laminarinivorans]MCB4798818.1 RagB/SusD family nutrient uptake outer membrane protein [Tamlana laminarinivorans]
MKKILYIILPCIFTVFTSCEDEFIDLTPPASITEDVYYNEAEHFLSGSNRFYTYLTGWGDQPIYSSHGSDLVGYFEGGDMQEYSRGETLAPVDDDYYTDTYEYIRDINLLLERAESYSGTESIVEYVAASKFHRAFQYFFLVQRYGGVTLVTRSLDVNSEELYSARNSRYEVVEQIKTDLDDAIAGLPYEANIASEDKGKISKEAAMAFKAKVLLHEASWLKYVGTTTDGDGVSSGAGSSGYDAANITPYFEEVVTLTEAVMNSSSFELWNYNDVLDNLSSNFLFNLEDSGSNPAGLDKATNKEFILYGKYDFTFRQANTLVSHVYNGRLRPSRKMMDLFLCTDGLPITESDMFEGYYDTQDEFQNRDFRMRAYFTNHETLGEIPQTGDVLLNGTNNFGYYNSKFMSWKWGTADAYRATQTESYDIPLIRLAEVYLMYAEALYELNGSLTDAQMNASINLIKERAGLPPITNAFLAANNMDIETEIRRERAIELYAESSSRYSDLRRWGIAEDELGEAVYGAVIEGTVYEGNDALYTPGVYSYNPESTTTGVGERECILIQPASTRNFSRNNYLFPIPTSQIGLNNNLLQNPGY